jgi:hypothetical protein
MRPELPSGPVQRSRGESLLRRLTMWAGLGAMVATGAAAAVVANVTPGRSTGPTAANTSGPIIAGPGTSVGNPPSSGAGIGQGTAPAPSAATPAVTSGGS